MYIYKSFIDNYSKCPYNFAFSVLEKLSPDKFDASDMDNIDTEQVSFELIKSAKSKTSKSLTSATMNGDSSLMKSVLSKIALEEISTKKRYTIQEMRLAYTNKITNKADAYRYLNMSAGDTNKLNEMLSVFSNNLFVAYNAPVEIPIAKSNLIYRDIIDFVLVNPDDRKEICVVEFDDLSDSIQNLRYSQLIHYKIPYLHLAHNFKTDIRVIIFDPSNLNIKLEFVFKQDAYESAYIETSKILKKMFDMNMYKNLFACNDCTYVKKCLENK